MKTHAVLFSFVSLLLATRIQAQNACWERIYQTTGSSTHMMGSVDFVSATEGWYTTVRWPLSLYTTGSILHTVDGGLTWTSQGPGYRDWDVDFIENLHGCAAGWTSADHTHNGGANWTGSLVGTSQCDLRAVCMKDTMNIWVVGWQGGVNGCIYHSTNGGTIWTNQAPSWTPQGLNDVTFLDLNNGWAVGKYGYIIHTTNGGANWVTQNTGLTLDFEAVYFYDTSIGWVVGPLGTILYTDNGGATWTAQNSGTTANLTDITFDGGYLMGCAVGDHGTILRTIDGGLNWTIDMESGSPFEFNLHFRSVSASGQYIWAAGDSTWSEGTTTYFKRVIYRLGSYNYIAVTSPNGGEHLGIGTDNTIRWNSCRLMYFYPDRVNIFLNRDYPSGSWVRLSFILGTSDDGFFTWTVTGPATSNARIRITGPGLLDESDANFSIDDLAAPEHVVMKYTPEHVPIQPAILSLCWTPVAASGPVTYNIWADSLVNGTYSTLIGTTADTCYLQYWGADWNRKFYVVKAETP